MGENASRSNGLIDSPPSSPYVVYLIFLILRFYFASLPLSPIPVTNTISSLHSPPMILYSSDNTEVVRGLSHTSTTNYELLPPIDNRPALGPILSTFLLVAMDEAPSPAPTSTFTCALERITSHPTPT